MMRCYGPLASIFNEYARALYDAAALAGRDDLMKALAPSLKEQINCGGFAVAGRLRLFLGRSLGAISYMDTMEIACIRRQITEFRPAPLRRLLQPTTLRGAGCAMIFTDELIFLGLRVWPGDYSYITRRASSNKTTPF